MHLNQAIIIKSWPSASLYLLPDLDITRPLQITKPAVSSYNERLIFVKAPSTSEKI